MQVNTSKLPGGQLQAFAALSGNAAFYKALEKFVSDNPIGIQRGMDWNGSRVIGYLEDDVLYITQCT